MESGKKMTGIKTEELRVLIHGGRMIETAGALTGFHRIQASTGFRRAAEYCAARLGKMGVGAEILRFPADGKRRSPAGQILLEWDIKSGACEVEGFGEIANFARQPLSVLPRSAPCDFRGSPLEIVLLDKSEKEEDYEGLDLTGKLVFVRKNHEDFSWAMEKRGARGVITDYVLHPETQKDVIRYASFWLKETADEEKYFGFGLPPSLGEKLAAFCLEKSAQGEKVMARGFVDSSIYEGNMDAVTALICGESKEEILITAHLCHPQSSANDNASGVAAGIEIMAALKAALDQGILPKLSRGVRLLLIPEMNGTIAYLGSPGVETKNILAGINLDMVGARQEKGYGPITLTCLHRASPSFTEYAAIAALEEAARSLTGFNGAEKVPLINYHIESYAAGSDHYILSDPTVGVPCTMLGQWPDAFYHTSGDTIDKLSPDVLSVSAATGLFFSASLAALTPGDLDALFVRGKLRLAEELCRHWNAVSSGALDAAFLDSGLRHITASRCAGLEDALRFFPASPAVLSLVEKTKGEFESLGKNFGYNGGPAAPAGFSRGPVPRRKYPLPAQDLASIAARTGNKVLGEEYEKILSKEFSESHSVEAAIQYYIDGRRSVEEIIFALTVDLGGLTESAARSARAYIDLLEKCGLIEWAAEQGWP